MQSLGRPALPFFLCSLLALCPWLPWGLDLFSWWAHHAECLMACSSPCRQVSPVGLKTLFILCCQGICCFNFCHSFPVVILTVPSSLPHLSNVLCKCFLCLSWEWVSSSLARGYQSFRKSRLVSTLMGLAV